MLGLGVYFADPAPSRSFPIVFSDGEIVYPQFAYPLRNEIIPIYAAALMACKSRLPTKTRIVSIFVSTTLSTCFAPGASADSLPI